MKKLFLVFATFIISFLIAYKSHFHLLKLKISTSERFEEYFKKQKNLV